MSGVEQLQTLQTNPFKELLLQLHYDQYDIPTLLMLPNLSVAIMDERFSGCHVMPFLTFHFINLEPV